MAADPFGSRVSYGKFLYVQHGLHRDIEPLYRFKSLKEFVPDLTSRTRLAAVEQDLSDLKLPQPEYTQAPATEAFDVTNIPEALGWLYVVEGSNLGAAFLLKFAKKIGLSETFGARHLAEPPEGRAPYWRLVKAALDTTVLTPEEISRSVVAANTAFANVRALAQQYFSN
jgi:heme oxygenase